MNKHTRYIVTVSFPHPSLKVGDRICRVLNDDDSDIIKHRKVPFDGITHYFDPEKYPEVFRRLKWWEYREIKDMPMYLKDDYDGKITKVIKVENWLQENNETLFRPEGSTHYISMVNTRYSPATEQEYYSFFN